MTHAEMSPSLYDHRKVKIPALVISGGVDPAFTEEMGAELAAKFTLGQHLHLAEAGHLLIAEYPDLVNKAIAEFIDKTL